MSEVNTATGLDNFDALLDTHYSEIPALPKFCAFPTGIFKLRAKECKVVPPTEPGKEPRIDLTCELLEAVEIAEGQAVPTPEVGSLVSYMFSGSKGVQRFNEVCKDLMVAMGLVSPRQMIEQFATVEMHVQNKSRAYKDKLTNEVKYGNDVQLIAAA